MKVCLGQINTTPGDFPGNLAAMQRGIQVASAAHCDVIVFPELSIPGYLSQDLLYHQRYIDRNLEVLETLVDESKDVYQGLHIVVGYVDRNTGVGKPFFNMAGVIRAGQLIGEYQKQLLPFYDVFDELRYFEPGENLLQLEIAGKRVGITICEDLWNDKGSDDYNYDNNPLQHYRQSGVEIVLSLNSSPFVHDKSWQRLKVIAPGSKPDLTIVYVNQRGGQDELVFDGQSFIVQAGELKYLSSEVDQDSFDIVDLDNAPTLKLNPLSRESLRPAMVPLKDLLVLCLRDYVEKSGFKELVLASSGGVDSAVVCELACEAVGPENVHAIRMPSIFSSDHARDDALTLHHRLGCWDYCVEIEHKSVVDMLNDKYAVHRGNDANLVVRKLVSGYSEVADENIQARLRDLYVMHFSNAYGAMPLSTGNKTESACGYYTHFDMNFSFAPIKDLYKYQVVELAKNSVVIPDNIWQKPPSAELAEGQIDEESLLAYAVLDPIVKAYIEDYVSSFVNFVVWVQREVEVNNVMSMEPEVLLNWLDSDPAQKEYQRIVALIGRMEFKRRQTCPGTKVSRVAFGIGRRIPIVEKWS